MGRRNGPFRVIHPDGAVEKGTYKEDKWEGTVEITDTIGEKFTVEFKEGQQVGKPVKAI